MFQLNLFNKHLNIKFILFQFQLKLKNMYHLWKTFSQLHNINISMLQQ